MTETAPKHLLMLAPTGHLHCDARIIDMSNCFCNQGWHVTIVCPPQEADNTPLFRQLLHPDVTVHAVPESVFLQGEIFDLEPLLGRQINTPFQRLQGQWLYFHRSKKTFAHPRPFICNTANKTLDWLKTLSRVTFENQLQKALKHGFWHFFFSRQLPPSLYRRYKGAIKLEAYNYFCFIESLTFHRDRPFDCVYSNDLWSLPVACLMKELLGLPLIYDTHEIGTTVIEDEWLREAALEAEPWMYRLCDRFLTVNDSCARYYKKHFPFIPEPIVITNGHPTAWQPASHHTSLKKRLGLPPEIILGVYVGSMHAKTNLDMFIQALQYSRQDLCLAFLGGGGDIARFKALSQNLGFYGRRVFFLDRVSYQEVPPTIYGADFGIIPNIQTIVNFGFNSSSKLFDYVEAELPVISDRGPEIRKILDEFKIGEMVDFNQNAAAIAPLLDAFAEKILQDRFPMSERLKAKQGLTWPENVIEAILPPALQKASRTPASKALWMTAAKNKEPSLRR